ncbi:NAD(P)-binding protein [Mollisia scopiformis]|uniref:NAD(P)-binding protein n=1 Tax=Mollisia scopiformis TaxID=149040 RepID=A0A194WW40_MOLSC|nr:NAD(P)-binding protein [Mollisia scopiformis]KUJ11889.1 NAD(P)-binding protein [Mollisia scopiformis]
MVASKNMPRFPDNFFKVFWNNQFRVKIELPTRSKYPSLAGKVAIITGANSGLGFESARQLLTLGLSHLVVAVRSIEKGNAAASKLKLASPKATIDVWQLDMESYDSIQSFVKKCDTTLSRIDYVILNAGVGPLRFGISSSTGHETAIQVNFLSTVLLAILLLPVLKAKSTRDMPAHMTIVNSVLAHTCKFPNRDQRPLLPSFDDTKITPWDPSERYGVSKLLTQLFLVELTEHVKSDDVIINMVDPGATKGTGLGRDVGGMLLIGYKLFQVIAARPVDRGAATYVDALLGHGKESHGCFLMNTEIAPLATFYHTADGKKATQQIWEETMKELSFAHVKEIIASME